MATDPSVVKITAVWLHPSPIWQGTNYRALQVACPMATSNRH